jgi:hypothetical protein
MCNGIEEQSSLLMTMSTEDLPDLELLTDIAGDLKVKSKLVQKYIEKYQETVTTTELQ